jgi:hypothetical protein
MEGVLVAGMLSLGLLLAKLYAGNETSNARTAGGKQDGNCKGMFGFVYSIPIPPSLETFIFLNTVAPPNSNLVVSRALKSVLKDSPVP